MLDCVNVVKRYGGKFAVNGMSVAIEDAHIYGLLGPNGSGKSTWMKMAAGLIVPDEGEMRLDGVKISAETKKHIAYMPTEGYFYSYMKIKDVGRYYQDFFDDFDAQQFEKLIADIDEAVYQRIMENRTVSEEEAKETAKIVGLAALKYGDLSNQASKDYIFDVDRFTSFEGNTGPYILYTIVRIKSILHKYHDLGKSAEGAVITSVHSESEKNLMLEISKFNAVIDGAFADTAPHKICSYIYDLANAFNSFYHETKIMSEEDETVQKSYIRLLELTKSVLETSINLLGFSAPERM